MNNFIKNDSVTINEVNGKFVINVPKGTIYLNEVFETLPHGIFNKFETGCGATSVVLENAENTIICCPSKALIDNKVSQYPMLGRCNYKLLGVYQGVTSKDILQYVSECNQLKQPVKIMVTYESFHKVKNTLIDSLIDYKIVVDEYHEFLGSASYRSKPILKLLNDIKDYSNVTYLSATPISLPYRPIELRELKEYEIHWEDSTRISVLRKKTTKPYASVVNIINDHRNGISLEVKGHKVEQCFFFINSVTAIRNIIDNASLSNDDVTVICADNKKNRNILGNIKISGIENDPQKSFIFCTKTVFQGADFYSEAGLIIIVSDARNKSTMLDISTDVHQIAGRIRNRNNPFKHVIFHIYSTGIGGITKEKFDAYLKERGEEAEAFIELYNKETTTAIQRKALFNKIRDKENDELVIYNEDTKALEINILKKSYMEYRFNSIDMVYRNGILIRNAYIKEGFDVTTAQEWENISGEYLERATNRPDFQTLYEEYCIERARTRIGKTDRARAIEEQNEQVVQAYNYMSKEEVERVHYNLTVIRKIIYSRLPDTKEAIKESLENSVVIGGKYSSKEIKESLQSAYSHSFVELTATSKDIKEYYEVKEIKVKRNGKRIGGYEILGKLNTNVALLSYSGEIIDYLKPVQERVYKVKAYFDIFLNLLKTA